MRKQESQPAEAPAVTPFELMAVEGAPGLFRVPTADDGGPGVVPPGFVETYHPQHGRLMTPLMAHVGKRMAEKFDEVASEMFAEETTETTGA